MSQIIQPQKVMIFLDFWNYELTMKHLDSTFLTDWFKLPQAISDITQKDIIKAPVQYEKLHIFGSYDPSSTGDLNLKNWATTTLAKIPGCQITFLPRQKITKGPCCTGQDHHEIKLCPQCQSTMLGTQEKGIDTHIAIEMMDAAYSSLCDVIVLISADKDFIPSVTKISSKGVKVINAYFPRHGHQLAQMCWGRFNLYSIKETFRR